MPFVKLDTGILDSSLWSEPAQTCKCWITLLAMANSDGLVQSTAPGIARRANLGLADTEKALEIFESPDQHSRTLDNQGKRIRRTDGGYEIINYGKYRERDYTAAERMRRKRERDRNVTRNGCNKTVMLRKQKQSTEADNNKSSPNLVPNAGDIYSAYPRKVARPAALRAIEKCLKRFGASFLLERTMAYAKTQTAGDPYTPHPATWFNQHRFNDDPETWSREDKTSEGKTPYQIRLEKERIEAEQKYL